MDGESRFGTACLLVIKQIVHISSLSINLIGNLDHTPLSYTIFVKIHSEKYMFFLVFQEGRQIVGIYLTIFPESSKLVGSD